MTDFEERKVVVEEERLKLERKRDALAGSFLSRAFSVVTTALISVAAIIFSVVQYVDSTKRAKNEAAAAEARANRDFDMETYKVVVASLGRRDTAEQLAALRLTALVNDSGLRAGLLDALGRSGAAVVRTEAKAQVQAERQFAVEQATVQVPPLTGAWRYDVFYCESSSPQMSVLADSVIEAIRGDQTSVRKRALPASINLRQGYRVAGYEIRYEIPELLRAEEVRRRLDRFDAPGRAFHLVPVSNRTPNYLSVFVCP